MGVDAPTVKRYWAELKLPLMCSVVDNTTLVLSYQPRDARLEFSKFSEKSSVPPGGGGGGGAVTVTEDDPLLPRQVAVTVAVPAPIPAIVPVAPTLAIPELLVDQVTVCPVIVFPF